MQLSAQQPSNTFKQNIYSFQTFNKKLINEQVNILNTKSTLIYNSKIRPKLKTYSHSDCISIFVMVL